MTDISQYLAIFSLTNDRFNQYNCCNMKITVIGGGSPYTPELISKLAEVQNRLSVDEICLMDIDGRKLDIMHGFCTRYGNRLGLKARISKTTDRKRALDGADFVNTQIRVGGNASRVKDEKIPLSHGLIGQETTGAGGFAKALRTIPAMLDIAHDVEKICPNAWIINYTNPTGLVAEAVTRYTKAHIAGLCAGGFNAQRAASKALGVSPHTVHFNLAGLNHLSFAYNITINGRPVNDAEFAKIAEEAGDKDLYVMLGAIPISYLRYYFHTAQVVKTMQESKQTRGEQVLEMEAELYAAFADPACDTRPAILDKRGGGGYSDCAISAIEAIHLNQDLWSVANIPNKGVLRFLPDNAVIETPCIVNAGGFWPILQPPPPETVWGLISAVKNYEQLAVEAAVSGSRETALMALLAHPLVGDFDAASELLPEILEGSREYLPQFFTN